MMSLMDGFAVAAASTYGARPESPRLLALGPEAHPVNTGHLMPAGTDTCLKAPPGQPCRL